MASSLTASASSPARASDAPASVACADTRALDDLLRHIKRRGRVAETETRVVVIDTRSRKKTSATLLVSPATKFVAREMNAT